MAERGREGTLAFPVGVGRHDIFMEGQVGRMSLVGFSGHGRTS